MNGQGQLRGTLNIRERPAEADDRAVPGHWEGDLLMGKRMHAMATLVERKTRFVMLIALPNGHAADVVADALAAKIVELPEQLRRSLTWDQGKEMAAHARFSVETGVPVYFCDPRSPWQRGSNENTNGLLRQYFPKRTEIAHFTQADLDDVAAELNGRPRQTLGWKITITSTRRSVAMTTWRPQQIRVPPLSGTTRQMRQPTRQVARSRLRVEGALFLDEDHERLGHDAVVGHRLGRRLGLHGRRKGIEVRHVRDNRHVIRVLRIHEGADVGDAKRTEELLSLRRGEPVILPLRDVVVPKNGRHSSSCNVRNR